MNRALVTGATGFIGPHLVRELHDRGLDVTCLRRQRSNVTRLEPLGVRFVEGDVTASESLSTAIEDCDVVFHLAGLTKALRRSRLFEVNEAGTRNLLHACAARESPPVVVLVSSLAAGGPAVAGRSRRETDEPHPVSNYGRSKRAAELAAHEFAERVPITVVRPPVVFGEGDDCVFQMFVPIKWFRIHFVPTWRTHRLSLIHAADLASHLVLAAEKGKRIDSPSAGDDDSDGGIQIENAGYYYLAAARDPTFSEMGRMFGRALGRRFTVVIRAPIGLTWMAAAVSEVFARTVRRPRIFNLDKAREAAAGSWTCSAARSHEELGWRCDAPLEARLEQTVRWYRYQHWL